MTARQAKRLRQKKTSPRAAVGRSAGVKQSTACKVAALGATLSSPEREQMIQRAVKETIRMLLRKKPVEGARTKRPPVEKDSVLSRPQHH